MAYQIIKHCPICRQDFATNRDAAIFCGWACYQEHHKSEPVSKTCKGCGKEFVPNRQSANAKRKINHCSPKCRGTSLNRKAAKSDYSARFWAKVDKSGECWNWIGAMRSKKINRGMFIIAGKRCVAYHIAYKLTYGVQDFGGLFVCHKCNNSACVRPDHLYLGTHLDNMQDRKKAGRYKRK